MEPDWDFLEQLCQTPGISGQEQRINEKITSHLANCDHIHTDDLGNLIVHKRSCGSSKKVMLAAHMDEIGFMVSHIDEHGFLRFIPIGGFDPKTVICQRVQIFGKEIIEGIVGSKPIHTMKEEDRKKVPEISDLFIDTGLPKEKVKKLISIGDQIIRKQPTVHMGPCISSKALDNRLSVFIVCQALKQLKNCQVDVYAVFCSQEEVGVRGARVAANEIQPDIGIALDVTIANDIPDICAHEHITDLGKGPAIKYYDSSCIPSRKLIKFFEKTAEDNSIPYQKEIMTKGGTDTSGIQYLSGKATIAGCISIPTRYIHTPMELAHKDDIRNSIKLLVASLESLHKF